MKRTIILLIFFPLFTVFSFLSAQADTLRKIGILGYSDQLRYADSTRGITDALAAAQLTEPRVSIIQKNADGSKAKAADLVQQFVDANMDLIFTIGTHATIAVTSVIKDTPVVFAQVYDPVDAGIARNWTSSGNNTTGTSTKIPVSKIMDILKQFAPVRRMGVLYAPDEKNSESQLRDIVANFRSDQSIKITPVPLAKTQEIDKLFPIVLRSVDALYITGSIFVDSQIAQIVDMAGKAHVLTVSHLDDMVRKGVLLGVCTNSYHVGRLAGEKGVRIMNGDRPSSIPIESPRQFDVIINLKTADNGHFLLPNNFTRTVTKTIR